MPAPQPYFREVGSGPGVICLHANASSSSQWRGLMEQLSPSHHVFAPDSYGAGKSPDWHSDREISLHDEVAFIEPLMAQAGTPLTLIGHSYGAAIALMAALQNPRQMRGLVLYEPTLFAVVEATTPPPNRVDDIRHTVRAASAALDRGERDKAASYFIDFWMGAGSWQGMPTQRKPAIVDAVANVRRWAHALFTESTPVVDFAALDIPVLYMLGGTSPESAHAVAEVLIATLPQVQVVEFPALGHMAPVTDPDAINAEIGQFLSGL